MNSCTDPENNFRLPVRTGRGSVLEIGSRILIALACIAAWTPSATAQTFPTRPLRLVVASAPGATTDIVARIVAQKLTDALGQQVAVDNRPGAGGNIAAEHVSKSQPDGHTMLLGFPGLATNPALYGKLGYDPQKDLAAVSLVSSGPLIVVVHPSLPVTSVKQLIAFAKQRPGELSFPSVGSGATSHLSVELFKSMAGVDMLHVPYKSFPQALVDLSSGRLSLMINAIPGLLPYVKNGRLRALAVTSKERTAVLPELPPVHEAGLRGYEVVTWNGILVPAGTPKEIVARLNAELTKSLKAPETREQFLGMGFDAIPSTPERFAAYIREETDKWARVIRQSGAKLD